MGFDFTAAVGHDEGSASLRVVPGQSLRPGILLLPAGAG